MPGQKEIGIGIASGIPGTAVTLGQTVYTDENPIATGGAVKVGGFVWRAEREEGDFTAKATGTTSGTTAPWGFVERNLSYPSVNLDIPGGVGGTLDVPDGYPLNVVVAGTMRAITKTAATVGQAVFAHTDGSGISTAASGSAPEGTVATGWQVSKGGDANDVIRINCHNPLPLAPAS